MSNNMTIEQRIEQLKMKNATKNMNLFGQILVDNRELSIWDRDTKSLPRPARRLRKKARKFAQEHIRPIAAEADLDYENFDSAPLLKLSTKRGFQSAIMAQPIGTTSPFLWGKATVLGLSIMGEEFATESGGVGLLLMAHHLGAAAVMLSGRIHTYLRHFLPSYLLMTYFNSQKQGMAYAITEPSAGSDAEDTEGAAEARLVTTAKPVKGGYVLNGSKCFISNGAIANKIMVFAKLEGEEIESWTCFMVTKDMEGYSVGRHEKKMGQRASDASEIHFDNVFVPKRNIIGKLRGGWAINRNVLNYSRPVVGAMALGQARGAFERCLQFCRRTRLGQKRLIDYQDIQLELSDMIISLWSARNMVWSASMKFRCNQAMSGTAKVFASDTAVKVCNQAMEIMGDHGYVHSNGIERAWRDARLAQIYEGTNQINRLSVLENLWDGEINKGVYGYGG